jgi:hypothetical protein
MENTLNYYDSQTNEEKSIQFELRFLTPKLRAEIIKYDAQVQLAYKKKQKIIESIDKTKLVDDFVQKLKKERPDISNEEILKETAMFSQKIITDISEEQVKENTKNMTDVWKHNDEWTIKFFQLIVNKFKLEEEDKKLITSDVNSDFWQNADIGKVAEINDSFRRKYQI